MQDSVGACRPLVNKRGFATGRTGSITPNTTHGHQASVIDDATMDLLALADETVAEGLMHLLGDMGVARPACRAGR
jgi:hypothetical protein